MARRIRWQIVVALVGALLVLLLLGQLALSTTAVSQPLSGGSYVEAVPGTLAQPVPLLNDPLTDPAGRDLIALLFDGLTRIGADGLPAPALAEGWQTDQDGRVYIFTLREDVTWHDGEPFNADDVLFTIRAIQSDEFRGDPSLSNFWNSVLVDRIDDYTVRFTLESPYAPFASVARVPILPQHLLGEIPQDEWAESEFASQLVGTGPYRLTSLNTERAVLEANPDYFRQPPFIERFEMQFVESPQAAISVLESGDVQALGASTALAPELAQVDLAGNINRATVPLDSYAVLTFNLREPPLNRLAFRRALAQGLDKSALVEEVRNGQVARLDSPMLPGWWSFDPTVGWYAYDINAAEQTLEQMGYTLMPEGTRTRSGEPIELPLITDSDPGRLAAAEDIARQWRMMGLQVDVTELESSELRERLQERDFVLALHGWARLGPDPDQFSRWHSSQAEEGLNSAGLEDETIDELLLNGRTAQDIAARNESYAAFQRRWVELVPSITLYQPLYTFTYDNTVSGLSFEQVPVTTGVLLVGREDRYRDISRWFVNSSREIRGTLR